MIELREGLRHLIAPGHVRGDFFAAGVLVDMSVGIDDLHAIIPPCVLRVRHCFSLARWQWRTVRIGAHEMIIMSRWGGQETGPSPQHFASIFGLLLWSTLVEISAR